MPRPTVLLLANRGTTDHAGRNYYMLIFFGRCEHLPLKTAVARARLVLRVTMLLASSSLRVARTRKSVMSGTRLRATQCVHVETSR